MPAVTSDSDNTLRTHRLIWRCTAALVLAVTLWLYLPALNGPYIADDISNLVTNQVLRPATLTAESLLDAAFSFRAGTLYRPLSMASFTLTYHLAGSDSPYAIKAVNLALHLLTGLALLLLARRLLPRLAGVDDVPGNTRLFDWLALFIAAWWLLHPLQISTVLYSVQRMTGLSAFFMAWACYVYVAGRDRMLRAGGGYTATFSGVALLGMLALLSKESGGLLPLLLLCIELTCYRFAWRDDAPRWARLLLPTGLLLPLAILLAYLASLYFGHGSDPIPGRDFTLNERLLTESRVLWIYLGWLLQLAVRPLSFYHDDLAISHSLTDPVTTLIACSAWLGVALLMGFALRRDKLRYLAFGFGWFLVLQLLESTVIPLELIWEHRVYLAAFGPMLAVAVLLTRLAEQFPKRGAPAAILVSVLLISFSVIDLAARIQPWHDSKALSESFVVLNPSSARAWSGLASDLLQKKQYAMARPALENAASTAAREPGYPLALAMVDCLEGKRPSEALRNRILDTLANGITTSFSILQFDNFIKRCVLPEQRFDATTMAVLMTAAANTQPQLRANAAFQAGRAARARHEPALALRFWQQTIADDPAAVLPRLLLADVYLELGYPHDARRVVDELEALPLNSSQTEQWQKLRARVRP